MAELFCSECGGKLDPDAHFCTHCGTLADTINQPSSNLSELPATRHQYPIQSKRRNNKTMLIILLVVVMAGILITGGLLVRALIGNSNQSAPTATLVNNSITTTETRTTTHSTTETRTTTQSTTETQTTTQSTTESDIAVTETQLSNNNSDLLPASAYVPVPGQIYLYDVFYVSGEYSLEEVVVGKVSDTVLSSVSIFMLEGDETRLSEQYDFIEKDDGIYLESVEGYQSLWLPAVFEEFTYWENEWEAYMIIAVDQTFETEEGVFNNCLIRSYEIPEAGYFVTQVLAPGHGIIYDEYSPDRPARELLDYYIVDLETANGFLQR